MKSAGTCVGFGLCAAGVLLLHAGPRAQPQFKAGTELVTVDVVATDIHGKPVKSLTVADFEIFEDGVAQRIQAFQFIDAATLPQPSPLPSGVFSNQDEPGGLFAVVLDELGVAVTDVRAVRRVAQRFFQNALRPNDYIAVVRSGGDSGFFLTPNRSLALDVIAQTSGRLDRGLRLEQAGETLAGADRGDLAGLTPASTGKASFDTLLDVVEKLRPITARRKAIIWFSRGGDISFDTFDALVENRPEGRADDRLTRLIAAARAANVAIYTLDPRGLDAPLTEGAGAPAPTSIDAPGTLRDLANATGGRALVNANDLNGALDRVAEENRAYYLLGYPNQADPKSRRPRKLQVRTRAAGVSLLHRAVIVPPAPNEKRADVVLAASPLPVRDLPIVLAPAAVAGARGRRGIVVPFEIGDALPDGAEVEYAVYALNAAGKATSQSAGRATATEGRVDCMAQLAAAAGIYQVRIAASVKNSGARGLAMATVVVPKGKSENSTCAGFVFEQPGTSAGFRRFSSNRPLTITTLVSAKALGESALEFGLGSADGPPDRKWPAMAGKPVESGLWQLSLQLKAPLPKGVADIVLLQNGAPLGEGCRTTFRME